MTSYRRRKKTNLQILKDTILHEQIGKRLENIQINPETHAVTTQPKPREVQVEESVGELKNKKKKVTYINTRLLLTKR